MSNTGSRFAPGRINVEPTGLSREILTAAEDVLLVKLMHLVFTRMPGESYRRRLRSLLLYLCYVFRALVISLVC